MRFISVCSGIEAASVAWGPLGWKAVAFSEIEPFPCAVLAHHYPDTPNWGDMTNYKDWPDVAIDLLCGGTPCQSFSVAGLRKGLDDPRGNLMLTFGAIAAKYRPKWLVWENVPGVLSSNGGRDFGSFLGLLGVLGYGFAYRVLDAQYFGVAQRRRRVFVVGCLGDWRSAAAVLFERESLCRDTAPSRKKREGAARSAAFSAGNSSNARSIGYIEEGTPPLRAGASGTNQVPTCITDARMVAFGEYADDGTASTCKARDYKDATDLVAHPMPINTMVALRHEALGRGTGFGIGEPGDPAYTLTKGHSHAVAHHMSAFGVGNLAGTLRANPGSGFRSDGSPVEGVAFSDMAVRRLTPIECERLQGFPDNYTNIPWRKKDESPDGPRYKALGNSMAVPVMRWIGERIDAVDAIRQAA